MRPVNYLWEKVVGVGEALGRFCSDLAWNLTLLGVGRRKKAERRVRGSTKYGHTVDVKEDGVWREKRVD